MNFLNKTYPNMNQNVIQNIDFHLFKDQKEAVITVKNMF